MALPREPRQKMINMMYLVLTALLALHVRLVVRAGGPSEDHASVILTLKLDSGWVKLVDADACEPEIGGRLKVGSTERRQSGYGRSHS